MQRLDGGSGPVTGEVFVARHGSPWNKSPSIRPCGSLASPVDEPWRRYHSEHPCRPAPSKLRRSARAPPATGVLAPQWRSVAGITKFLYSRWPRFRGEGETRTANHPNTRHTKRSCGSCVGFPGSRGGSKKASNVVGSIRIGKRRRFR